MNGKTSQNINISLNRLNFNSSFFKIITNHKLVYKVLKWIPNNDIINFMMTNRLINNSVKENKVLLKNAVRSKQKDIGEVLFFKDNYYAVTHTEAIQEMLIHSDSVYEKFSTKLDYLFYIWLILFIVLVPNIFFILLTLKIEQYFQFENDWYVLTPITLFWFISILTFSAYKFFINKRTEEIEDKITNFLYNGQAVFLHISSEEKERMLSSILCRNQNKNSSNFEKILKFIMLFYLPIFARYHWLTQFNNQITFTFSGVFVLGFFYVMLIYECIRLKCGQINSKLQQYEKLKEENAEFKKNYNNLIIDEVKADCFGEKMMTFLFFLSSVVINVLWLYYFICVGAKLDNSKDIRNHWCVLFIPIYLAEIPLIVFCILFGISRKTTKSNKIKIIVFNLLVFSGFLLNSILIPMRLDRNLMTNFGVIPGVFLASSILFLILIKCIINKE